MSFGQLSKTASRNKNKLFDYNVKSDARKPGQLYADMETEYKNTLSKLQLGYTITKRPYSRLPLIMTKPTALLYPDPAELTKADVKYIEAVNVYESGRTKIDDHCDAACTCFHEMFQPGCQAYIAITNIRDATTSQWKALVKARSYVIETFKPNTAEDATWLLEAMKLLTDTDKGIAVFTAEFIRMFIEICILGQEIPPLTVKVMLKAQIKNDSFQEAMNTYATADPPGEFRFDETKVPAGTEAPKRQELMDKQRFEFATRKDSPWRVFLDDCCKIAIEFPLRDITSHTKPSPANSATKKKKPAASPANSAGAASGDTPSGKGKGKQGQVWCNKCSQYVHPGQEGKGCTSKTCASCKEALTLGKFHNCPNFVKSEKGNKESSGNKTGQQRPSATKAARTERGRSRSRSRDRDLRKDHDRNSGRDRDRDDKSGDSRISRRVNFTDRSSSRDRDDDRRGRNRDRDDDRRDRDRDESRRDDRDSDKSRSYYGPSYDDSDDRDHRSRR